MSMLKRDVKLQVSNSPICLISGCYAVTFGRFLYEVGSPANQYYKKCLMEMRAEVALRDRDGGMEADTEDADGECSFV